MNFSVVLKLPSNSKFKVYSFDIIVFCRCKLSSLDSFFFFFLVVFCLLLFQVKFQSVELQWLLRCYFGARG